MAARVSIQRATRALGSVAPKRTRPVEWRPLAQAPQWQAQAHRRAFSATTAAQEKKYTEDHEWVEFDSSGKTMTLGISKYASSALGDVIYIELPELDLEVGSGDAVGAVESVKSASDILTPFAGKVVENNTALEETPSLLNKDPEGEGWICKIEAIDSEGLDKLMDEAKYKVFTEEITEE